MNIEKYTDKLIGVDNIPEGDLDNLKPEPIKPLLTIELQDEDSVPKVIYNGEEITGKVRVSFDWETKTEVIGGTRYNIEHLDNSHKDPTVKGYGLARGKYAFDEY